MTSRSLVRRPLQVGGLLLATAALGTATAPAALAMVDPAQPGADAPAQAPAEQARVLTNSPANYLGTPEEPVQFGIGKLQVSVAPEPDATATSPVQQLAGDAPDMAGAVVVVTVTDVEMYSDAYFVLDGAGETAQCTTTATGACSLTSDDPELVEDGQLRLVPGMTFTVQQTLAPASGVYALPPTGDDVVHGEVRGNEPLMFAPSTSQPSGSTPGSIRFYDPLVVVSGSSPAPGTAAGAPTPASPAAGTTPDPTTAAGATPAPGAATPVISTADTATALASTGADVGPMLAVGGGLLAAGAAGLVLARRRTAH